MWAVVEIMTFDGARETIGLRVHFLHGEPSYGPGVDVVHAAHSDLIAAGRAEVDALSAELDRAKAQVNNVAVERDMARGQRDALQKRVDVLERANAACAVKMSSAAALLERAVAEAQAASEEGMDLLAVQLTHAKVAIGELMVLARLIPGGVPQMRWLPFDRDDS